MSVSHRVECISAHESQTYKKKKLKPWGEVLGFWCSEMNDALSYVRFFFLPRGVVRLEGRRRKETFQINQSIHVQECMCLRERACARVLNMWLQ